MEDLKDVVLFFEKYWKYPMAKIILAVISILFPGLLGNIFIYIPDDKWLLRILFIFGGLILAYFGVKDLKISLKGKNTKKLTGWEY